MQKAAVDPRREKHGDIIFRNLVPYVFWKNLESKHMIISGEVLRLPELSVKGRVFDDSSRQNKVP